MPIDILSSLRKSSQFCFGSPFLNNILGSSLFVAGLVAVVMMLLVMIIYPAKRGTSISVVFKMFIYMFCTTLLIVFLHDGVLKFMMEEEFETRNAQDLMENENTSIAYSSAYVPVTPTTEKSNGEIQAQAQIQAKQVEQVNQVTVGSAEHDIQSIVEGGNSSLQGPRAKPQPPNRFKL